MLSVDHSPITNINKGGQSMHMLTTTHIKSMLTQLVIHDKTQSSNLWAEATITSTKYHIWQYE